MAEVDRSAHSIDGISSIDRYRNSGLSDICRFRSASGTHAISPEGNQLEVIGNIKLNSIYYKDGAVRHVADENAIAQALVMEWMKQGAHKNRILRKGIGRMGIGIDVTDNGFVYVTIDLCD
jgi:hypothetical protein